MRRSRVLVGLMLMSLVSVASAESVDDVVKKLDDAHKKLTSCSMKIKMEQNMDMGEIKSKTEMQGTFEFIRKDGKELSRMEMEMRSSTQGGGMDQKIGVKSFAITDGEFAWNFTEFTDGPMKGQKSAAKDKNTQTMVSSAAALKEMSDLKLMPDAKVEGQDCYVIEGAMKQMPTMKQVSYFRKNDGLAAKVVSFMGEKETGTTTMSDIKTNETIAADRFVWKTPEGVELQDNTKKPAPAPAAEKP
ncbi:MAG: hypothetical protein HZB38_07635 [Planctomycetes bacterium]|nr:hypothetical protein [Planctomycetota bacterium]